MSANVQKQTILPGHNWQVSCLEFSPDGLYLASGGWDKMVLIWDLRTLDATQKIGFHSQPVTCLTFQSSKPGLLATGSADQTVAIWNPVNGAMVRSLQHHSNWVLSASFSPNGRLIASASWDKSIGVCDIETGQVVSSLTGHTTGVWTCSFNPDDSTSSDTLCSGAEDGSLKVWDLRSKSVVMSLIGGHEDRIKCCAWSPSAQYVASSSADGKLVLWEPRSGTALTRIKAYDDSANRVAFYPLIRDNSVPLLFSVGGRTCNIWHPFRKQNKQLLSVKLNRSGEEIQALGISPDGSLLATGGSDKSISLSTVDISLDEIDALPVETADRTNRGTLLWKKYTRKVIDQKINTAGRSAMSPPSNPARKTSGSLVGIAVNNNSKVVRKTSGSLVGMVVQKHEIEEKYHIERAETPPHPSSEKLHAEPEVVLLHQRQKLRPRSENLSDFQPKPEQGASDQNELKSARQHLRKVRKFSNGSEVSSGSGPEINGHDYGAFAKVNGWNGIANGGHHNGYPSPPFSPPSSSADDQTVIVNVDSESEPEYQTIPAYRGSTNGYNPQDTRGVNVQPSSRFNHFNIPNGNRTGYRHINSPDDGESTSASSSSYYADIDDVAQEMMDLSRQVEDHRL